jgi:deoxyinosine 3'endonuclease (endonuclease V)
MSDLQNKMSLLKRDTQAIDVQIAAYRSMDSIQKRLQSLNLVAAADVSYVSPVGTAVARR